MFFCKLWRIRFASLSRRRKKPLCVRLISKRPLMIKMTRMMPERIAR
jgi:hypothetical protein